MRRILLVAALAAAALLPSAAAAAAPDVSVSVERTAIRARLGSGFVLRSTIRNRGAAPLAGLIAHLNVLSLDGGMYVDPEDWSSNRTRYLPSIPAGRSIRIAWKLSAVNAGRLGAYVAVLAGGAPLAPTAGPTVRVDVASRRTLDSGGILPLALGVPALLAALALAVRVARRRGRGGAVRRA